MRRPAHQQPTRGSGTTVTDTGPGPWSRGRLLGILAVAATVVVILLAGLGYAIYLAIVGVGSAGAEAAPVDTGGHGGHETAQGASQRDAIAARPMLDVPAGAAQPTEAVAGQSRPIQIPVDSGVAGPALVATGFPRTPQGAIGQLAQIDVAVLTAMNTRTAREVYSAWALPGGVAADEWWTAAAVESFLAGSGMEQGIASGAAIEVEPAAALVKGTDGPEWATVCVLSKLTATYRSEAAVAWAHCERMQWVGGRWMIAPGQPPAAPPATWPGTELAAEAGWRAWTSQTITDPGGNHHHG